MAELLYIYNDYMKPATDGLLDIGALAFQFNNLYITGKAYIDGIGETLLLDQGADLQFRDSDIFINSVDDGHMDFHADTSFDFNTTANDIILNFNGGTFSGIITWQHDLDRFDFSDDIMLISGEVFYFRDSGLFIASNDDGVLDIDVDTRLDLNIGTVAQVNLTDGKLAPTTDNDIDLGDSTHELKDAYIDGTLYTDGRVLNVVVKTSTYTATTDDDVIICNSTTAFTINLPSATGSGRRFIIKNINTGTVTVDGNSSDTIDGITTQTLGQYDSIQIVDYLANTWEIV